MQKNAVIVVVIVVKQVSFHKHVVTSLPSSESYEPALCESKLSSHRHSSGAHGDLNLAVAGCNFLLPTKL